MINLQTDKDFTILEMKVTHKLVKAIKDASLGFNNYNVSRVKESPVEALIIGKSKFDSMLSGVSALKSLPVKYKTLSFDLVSAGIRAEELYHLALGKSIFVEPSRSLADTGFEHKIMVKGTQNDNEIGNLISLDGEVIAAHPILDVAGVSARKAGGSLTVTSVAKNLGVVTLSDAGSSIADDIAVELVYQTKEHLVIELKDQNKKVLAVLVSKELNDYLLANA